MDQCEEYADADADVDEYMSVASEGGFQPASKRGRDPHRKVVYSSHCVEVFRRMRWSNATHCGRQPSSDNKENNVGLGKRQKRKKGAVHGSAADPYCELPTRIMRFDGAMEAWLEEIQVPRELSGEPQWGRVSYEELNDAAERYPSLSVLKEGNGRAAIWYFSPEFLHQFLPAFFHPENIGLEFWVQTMIEQGVTVQCTHVPVGLINGPRSLNSQARNGWLKEVFAAMQTSKWTPNGEGLQILLARRLTHSGMSIGDMVQLDSDLYVATVTGFVKIPEAALILPPRELMFGEEDVEVDVEEKENFEEKPEEEWVQKKSTGQKPVKEKLQKEKTQQDKPQKEMPRKKGKKWSMAQGPPKDRRGLREELQRRRKELSDINGWTVV